MALQEAWAKLDDVQAQVTGSKGELGGQFDELGANVESIKGDVSAKCDEVGAGFDADAQGGEPRFDALGTEIRTTLASLKKAARASVQGLKPPLAATRAQVTQALDAMGPQIDGALLQIKTSADATRAALGGELDGFEAQVKSLQASMKPAIKEMKKFLLEMGAKIDARIKTAFAANEALM